MRLRAAFRKRRHDRAAIGVPWWLTAFIAQGSMALAAPWPAPAAAQPTAAASTAVSARPDGPSTIASDCRPPVAPRTLPVRVIGPAIDAADLNDACRGAADAIDFLAPIGLTPPALLQIEIRPELPAEVGSQAVACWMVRTGRVVVLPHSQVRVRGQWLGQPMSRPLYRAIIAHEVAHALIGCLASAASAGPAPSGNASMGTRLPKAAHEYAAYVTLMASLPPAMRDAALAAYPQAAFASTTQINDLIYGLDPEAFGVAAWRHWQQQPDPMGFLRQVILGKAIAPLVLE